MKKCILLVSAAALLFCGSCAKEEPVVAGTESEKPAVAAVEPGNYFVVRASFGDEATKTYLDATGLQPLWEIGDEIAIINTQTGDVSTVTLTKVAGTEQELTPEELAEQGGLIHEPTISKDHRSCTFGVDGGSGITASNYYLVYPASCVDANLTQDYHGETGSAYRPVIKVPSTTDGSFKKANICMCYLSSSDFIYKPELDNPILGRSYVAATAHFCNVVSILRITDKTESIKKITIGQKDKIICGNYLAGLTGGQVYNLDDSPIAPVVDNGEVLDKITITGMNPGGPYYVAIHPRTLAAGPIAKYYTYEQADETKPDYTKSLTAETTLEKNKIYRIGFALPDDKCVGVFSVTDSLPIPGTNLKAPKKVSFSKGNLRASIEEGIPGNWSFAKNQYDIIGGNGANVGNDYATMDLFGWSTDGTNAGDGYNPWGINYSTTATDYSGAFVDWGSNIGEGWQTLSSDEWSWLLGRPTGNADPANLIPGSTCRKSSTVWVDQNLNGMVDDVEKSSECKNARFVKIRIQTDANKFVYGLLIFPDIFKWTEKMGNDVPYGINAFNLSWADVDSHNTYTITKFAAMENAGCAFLPAAGKRSGSNYTGQKTGQYWTSSPVPNNVNQNVYQMIFNGNINSYFVRVRGIPRAEGYSVRLVHE